MSSSVSVSAQTSRVSVRGLPVHLPRETPLRLNPTLVLGLTVVGSHQTALLLVVAVVPTLHIVRVGIDENIAFLLLSFGIVLSEDRMEVVQIVTFYTWLLEGWTVWRQFQPRRRSEDANFHFLQCATCVLPPCLVWSTSSCS